MQYQVDASGFEPTLPAVFTRDDGDVEVVWTRSAQQIQVRRFRSHLGHVVEVVGPRQRLRRIGPGLRSGAALRVDADLPLVVERALTALVEVVPHGPSLAQPVAATQAAERGETSMTSRLQRWLGGWLHLDAGKKVLATGASADGATRKS